MDHYRDAASGHAAAPRAYYSCFSCGRQTQRAPEAVGSRRRHDGAGPCARLTLHQAVDTNVAIACGDAPVWPGDVIVGDADGCIVIPAHLADEVAGEAVEMTAFEDFVFHCAAPGCFV